MGSTNIVTELGPADASKLAEIGIAVDRNVVLAPYTTMKIGGPADYFTSVATLDQMRVLVRWARAVQLPYFVLGGGSNMLISDDGIRGLVIYNRCRAIGLQGDEVDDQAVTEVATVSGYDAVLYAESGAAMAGAARTTVQRGFAGLEWAVSLPGTVGGAVVGNAGAYGGEVKDNLIQARIMAPDGDERCLDVAEIGYTYRNSILKERHTLRAGFGPVVLQARFGLNEGDRDALRRRADEFLAHRRRTQPVQPSLGSTFVNPPNDYAGRLIEAAGLKAARVGGVSVSETHANFLVNPGGVGSATAADVMELVNMIQERVHDEFGVELNREIQLAGEW